MSDELPVPAWALEPATPADRTRTADALKRRASRITWPRDADLRAWARAQGWNAPRRGLHSAFVDQMIASDASFRLALESSGIRVQIPVTHVELTEARLAQLDALYAERGADGRPSAWGALVDDLREYRQAVEAGVVVEAEGQRFRSFSTFYTWAHARYHALEDGYDDWFGMDRP